MPQTAGLVSRTPSVNTDSNTGTAARSEGAGSSL